MTIATLALRLTKTELSGVRTTVLSSRKLKQASHTGRCTQTLCTKEISATYAETNCACKPKIIPLLSHKPVAMKPRAFLTMLPFCGFLNLIVSLRKVPLVSVNWGEGWERAEQTISDGRSLRTRLPISDAVNLPLVWCWGGDQGRIQAPNPPNLT